ncbi:DNA-binding response regulator [Paenibacillus curdlanolyticus]|nr:DNA-binding response regulator [Paenibacillus curdlanolyticus]
MRNYGYGCFEAGNGKEAYAIFQKERIDLVLADVMMPEMDGIELLKTMRQQSQVPFLFLSAKSDAMDRINGLQLGADDYIGKPFNPIEVVSRIQALFRRAESYAQMSHQRREQIEIAGIKLDLESCQLYVHGEKKDMTSYEFRILALLMSNAGRVYTKAQIYEQVWGEEYMGDENLVMVYISKLRDKIEDNPRKPVHLITIRGLGYRFEKR